MCLLGLNEKKKKKKTVSSKLFSKTRAFSRMQLILKHLIQMLKSTNTKIYTIVLPKKVATAMYKTRNAGTGNGMRGTRGIGGMWYSGECRQKFQGMSRIFRGMSPNNPGNVAKYSGQYRQRLRGMPRTGWLSNSTVGCLSMFYYIICCLQSI